MFELPLRTKTSVYLLPASYLPLNSSLFVVSTSVLVSLHSLLMQMTLEEAIGYVASDELIEAKSSHFNFHLSLAIVKIHFHNTLTFVAGDAQSDSAEKALPRWQQEEGNEE